MLVEWFAFVCAAGLAIAYPGPTMLTVISYSLTYGRRSYVPVLVAVALGDSTALAFSFVLAIGVLDTSQSWLSVVNVASGVYLLFFGVKRLLADTSPAELEMPLKSYSRWRLFINTYLVTGTNLKSIPLLLLLLDTFVDKNADVTRQRFTLAVTFVILSVIVATLYMIFAALARRVVASSRAQRRFQIVGGLLLLAAGLWALGRGIF